MNNRTVTRRRRLGSGPKEEREQQPTTGRIRAEKEPFSGRTGFGVPASLFEPPPSLNPESYSSREPSPSWTSEVTIPNSQTTDMPSVERTPEFRAVCKSVQMKVAANGFRQPSMSPKAVLEETKRFNALARNVGHDLSQTCAKLEKLALLAKKKMLFDEQTSEMDQLTNIIKQDIAGLNNQLAQLQKFAVMRSNAVNHTKPANQTQNHSKSVVICLQSKLASMSNEFKQVLQVRTENLKTQRTRREKYGHNQSVPSSLPPAASSGQLSSLLLSDEYASGSSSVVLDMNGVQHAPRQQQQLLMVDQQDTYVRSRAEAMENIESTVVELGQIFNQLAHMVQEQGEMVQRIDSNVEDAALNVEGAHMELLKYFRNISNNRWLALKVFGILIIFFIIFVVFMV